jgi:hypothetical protein
VMTHPNGQPLYNDNKVAIEWTQGWKSNDESGTRSTIARCSKKPPIIVRWERKSPAQGAQLHGVPKRHWLEQNYKTIQSARYRSINDHMYNTNQQ